MTNETVNVLREQVERLTKERDEARTESDESLAALVRADAEVTRLAAERDEALDDIERHMRTIHKRDRAVEVAESEVTRLTAERDEWRALATKAQDQRDQWMSKAGELTEEVVDLRVSYGKNTESMFLAEARLSDANALLERARDDVYIPHDLKRDINEYLSGTSDTNPRI